MKNIFYKDKLKVKIFETRSQMGEDAAKDIAAAIHQLLEEKENVNIMFSAAPSQNDVHKALREDSSIAWNRIRGFHMDEYVGLAADHPAGFANFLMRNVFGSLPFASVNLIDGNAASAEAEAARYTRILKENPIDICVMGVGENGHVAFNDPGEADFRDPQTVKVVNLDDVCRQQQVNDGCFETFDEVPKQALSVTVPGLMAAPVIFCIVPAPTKAKAIKRMLEGEIDEMCPATILRIQENATLYLDADSASLL
ncbi:MAG: glucosamine-6-phosphate deaminase [Firmicutes bacterium]|nr:glucosamine-6-phosphate deaminase [Bacillota bacterium]